MGRIVIDRQGRKAVQSLQRMRLINCKVCGTLYSQRQYAECPKCKENVNADQ